ncbi:MAG: hypothetical protein ACREIP_16630, partial [Alphaproteobacteria bacterium]
MLTFISYSIEGAIPAIHFIYLAGIMRISRTNFPIKSDDYEGNDRDGRQPVDQNDPMASAERGQALRPSPPYTPVDVRRASGPQAPDRLAAPTHPIESLRNAGYVLADSTSAPISKRMFSLSENVRFTRTPDSELQKNKETHADAPAPEITKAASAALPRQPIEPRRHTAPAPKSVAEPKASTLPVHAQGASASAAQPAHRVRRNSPFAFVSDHAFWESMDLAGVAVPNLASVAAAPRIQFSPDEITAHFRVVECKQIDADNSALKREAPTQMPERHHDSEPTKGAVPSEPARCEPVAAEPVTAPVAPPRMITPRHEMAPSRAPLPRHLTVVGGIDPHRQMVNHHGKYEKPPVTLLQEAVVQDGVTIS